ncbi:MAG: group III truncated hemoglobin [Phycisphaeraceae bacterium]|nr:MAG: group III truncated hemoglobin [Phycisphaeraceae bacterium]
MAGATRTLPLTTTTTETRGGYDVTEADIRRLVVSFYETACEDEMIGPIFRKAVDDWEAHYDKLTAFWSTMVLGTDRYAGRPAAAAHMPLHLTKPQFERWLAIWASTAESQLGARAHPFVEQGGKMARSMSRYAPRK